MHCAAHCVCSSTAVLTAILKSHNCDLPFYYSTNTLLLFCCCWSVCRSHTHSLALASRRMFNGCYYCRVAPASLLQRNNVASVSPVAVCFHDGIIYHSVTCWLSTICTGTLIVCTLASGHYALGLQRQYMHRSWILSAQVLFHFQQCSGSLSHWPRRRLLGCLKIAQHIALCDVISFLTLLNRIAYTPNLVCTFRRSFRCISHWVEGR